MKTSLSKRATIGTIAGIVIIVAGISLWLTQKIPPKHEEAMEQITLGAYGGDTAALVWIAKEQDYFREHGLDVTIKTYEAGKLAADALLAGEVDFATSADFVFVSNSFDREDLRIVCTIANAEVIYLVARKDKGIHQVADLKGKKIGITRKSAAEFFLGNFLVFNHLRLEDIEVVDLKPSEIVDALSRGEIDAGFTWEPNIYHAKKRLGTNSIIIPGQNGEEFFFVLISTQERIKKYSSASRKLVEALSKAEIFIKKQDAIAKEIIGSRFGYEIDYLDSIWQKHDFKVELSQELLISMDHQARWRIEKGLTNKTKIPNYLSMIYLDAMETVKADAVTFIR